MMTLNDVKSPIDIIGPSADGLLESKCNIYRAIGLMSRVFHNDPGDRGSILVRVIPKTQKIVLDAALLNTQHYKVNI